MVVRWWGHHVDRGQSAGGAGGGGLSEADGDEVVSVARFDIARPLGR
jgi:hypothetical protein